MPILLMCRIDLVSIHIRAWRQNLDKGSKAQAKDRVVDAGDGH